MAADNRKGLWPRTQQHGTEQLPRTKHKNTEAAPNPVAVCATRAGRLNDWLHSGGPTIEESGGTGG